MPLAFQTQRVNLNSTAYFHFNGDICLGNYVVGGTLFSLYYPDFNAYTVRELDMSLTHGMQDAQTVYVTVTGNLEDDNHHVADPKSGALVTVIAWVGTSDQPTLVMENVTGVAQSSPYAFDIPPNALEVYTFLAGIHLTLPEQQEISEWSASCVANVDPINKRVTISGDSLLNGVHGTVDVGFVVTTSASAPFQIITASESESTIPFPHPIDGVCSLLTSFGGDFSGGDVILMAADGEVFVDDPYPTSSVTAGFGVNIVNHSHGTENGNVNATLIGLSSASRATPVALPTIRARLFRPSAPGPGQAR